MNKVLEQEVISKETATELILLAKRNKNLTFDDIAKVVGRHPVWTASAIMGQATMSKEEADALVKLLDLSPAVSEALQVYPTKGSLENTTPVDPLIYRFYEIVQVYGTTFKQVIQEKCGDGIMSAIDFTMDIEKKEDPKGDRIVITMDGKFLPYKKW